MTEPATERVIDWEEIEAQFRAGQLSVRAIAKLHGISKTAIEKRAKKANPPWTRNLAAKVQERVATKLVEAVATSKSAERAVEQAADLAVKVLINHRQDIHRLRQRRDALLAHLDRALNPPAPKKEGQAVVAPIGASEHATILERISRIEQRIQTLERAAWNLGPGAGGELGGGGDAGGEDGENDVETYKVRLPDNGRS